MIIFSHNKKQIFCVCLRFFMLFVRFFNHVNIFGLLPLLCTYIIWA